MERRLKDNCNGLQTGSKTHGADVAQVANVLTEAGIPVLHRITVADVATGNVDVVLDAKTRVLDAWVVKTGGAGGASDTIQLKNGSDAISDAVDINIADKVVARVGTIDDAYHEIAAGGTLRVARTKSSGANVECEVYVLGVKVA